MNIENGNTIRLKSSLKRGEIYGYLPFLTYMDVRPNRLIILRVDGDKTAFCRLKSDLDFTPCWYTFEMLDMRTLRKGTANGKE